MGVVMLHKSPLPPNIFICVYKLYYMNSEYISHPNNISMESESNDNFETLLEKYAEYYYSKNIQQPVNKHLHCNHHINHHINPYDHHSHNHHEHVHEEQEQEQEHEQSFYEEFVDFVESIYGTISDYFKSFCRKNRGIDKTIEKLNNPYEPNTHEYLMYNRIIQHYEKSNNNSNNTDNYVTPMIYRNDK